MGSRTPDEWRRLRGVGLEQAMLAARWYVRPNDLIGGWSVMPEDLPPSSGVPEIADFLSRRSAQHVVDLHNKERKRRPGKIKNEGEK